jgi:type 1 fimbria pilin
MPTEIYKVQYIYTVDNEEIEVTPLKIVYIKQLMDAFNAVHATESEDETITVLAECARIAMKQYFPELSKSVSDVENNFDLETIYKILDYGAGIKINKDNQDNVTQDAREDQAAGTWEDLDLLKLETEAFLLGIWKNYDELERSLSVQELIEIISTRRELDYEEKKFSAALQGVDLDGSSAGSDGKVRGQKEWDDLKARVFSGGQTSDSNDVLALQGPNARKAGFGIGMGLGYQDMRDPEVMKT